MARFSERYGYVKARDALQLESMDNALRNGLWNVLDIRLWSDKMMEFPVDFRGRGPSRAEILGKNIWLNYFKERVANAPVTVSRLEGELQKRFYSWEWHEVYDFIEFLLEQLPGEKCNEITRDIDIVLERERSGYRLMNGTFVRITDENELEAIEEAANSPFGPAAQHIQQAIRLYANRQAPDYRNVVKESISAVESAARKLTGKDDLARALGELETKHQLHPVLKQGFVKLYGYTNGEDGIRHAMLDDKVEVTEADARYMLVTCSAFVNYLVSRFGS